MGIPDPSWCARINGRGARPGAAPLPPASRAAAEVVRPPALPDPPPRPLSRREVPKVHTCECCGTVMYEHNCKIVCPNCGYRRDCTDP